MDKLIIPGEFPGLNKIVDAAKAHYHKYREMKEANTELISWPAKQLPKYKSLQLNITWYCKDRRRDPDNIAAAVKFIFDGLVDAGVIENDGWKQNKGWNNNFEVDKENPRVEIEISGVLKK